MIVLIFSFFVSVFCDVSFVVGASDVAVSTEVDLKNAINNAQTGKSTVITLNKDITLTTLESASNYSDYSDGYALLVIPPDKNITLTSNKANGYYKLIGATNGTVICVVTGAVLRLDGITITPARNVAGCGVSNIGGTLYLYSGSIMGNKAYSWGGVHNDGVFEMSGGTISDCNNTYGSGVWNSGTFSMFGGTISGNVATSDGGGVYNTFRGAFTMTGGTISGNTATERGGGVHIVYGEFAMSGGEVSGNTAHKYGGGVYNAGGGIYDDMGLFVRSAFVLSGGKVVSNTAYQGGGLYNEGTFTVSGGMITSNTASNGYNDVYPDGGDDLSGGNDGFSNGNSGMSNGNNGLSIGGFSLRGIVTICVIAAIIMVCIVLVVLYVSSLKRI
ncbi:MAG: hypothetical protein FWH37_05745 [Candidatus Bathyarchaeota archaeon]|nr:hypothetical protein [Candidatus Termiticorpusculum sp.]